LKKINYIFFLLFLGFLGKNVAFPANAFSVKGKSKENQLGNKTKKHSASITYESPKIKSQKRPHKPKGIQVIVPNMSLHTFRKFYRYSDFNIDEVKGNYSLLLHCSHDERGPPANLI